MTPGWLLCGRFWVDEADGVRELHAGLPWFLDDMRPQGFMGRTFAHTHPALGLAADPRHWSADDALKALASAGLPAARPQVFFISNRLFLESERFDRTAAGRIGMVSLQVYDAQYVGQEDNWAATGRMEARSLLRSQEAAHLRLLEAYGVLIANTDRHYGNISLLLDDDDWQLSPTYDMLPMLYAPVGGELVPRDFAARPLQPSAATLNQWTQAKELAVSFWQTAAQDARISAGFRAVAADNLQTLRAL